MTSEVIYGGDVQAYDHPMASAVVADELRRRGRGSQTQLATHLGVSVGTVNKWFKGHNSPELYRWRDIERFFEWPPGHIASVTGLNRYAAHGPEDIGDQVPEFALGIARDLDALRHEVRRQGERLASLEALLQPTADAPVVTLMRGAQPAEDDDEDVAVAADDPAGLTSEGRAALKKASRQKKPGRPRPPAAE